MNRSIEKWMDFSKQTFHAVLPPITQQMAVRIGWDAAREAIAQREGIIAREKLDPLRYGWEPPFWWICDAMRGQRFASPAWEVRFPGVDWLLWAEWVRNRFGLEAYWKRMLISGANRAGKSEYAAKRVVLTLVKIDGARAWCFHSSSQNNIDMLQPLIFKYLPVEWRDNKIKGQVGYISYTMKNGFTDGNFVTPNAGHCSFRNYEQDRSKIEGGEVDIVWADELIPADWVDALKARVATRRGSVMITFTPVEGYTPTVRMFEDGAETLLDTEAALIPKDGGEPDMARAFGFASLEDMLHAHDYGRWSLAEEFAWLDEFGRTVEMDK